MPYKKTSREHRNRTLKFRRRGQKMMTSIGGDYVPFDYVSESGSSRYWQNNQRRQNSRRFNVGQSTYESVDVIDEETRNAKLRAAFIVRNRLMSLSDEYKNNSIKQLMGKAETSPLPSNSTEADNKQVKRIAHVPKPVVRPDAPSQPVTGVSQEATHLAASSNVDRGYMGAKYKGRIAQNSVIQRLMEDLMIKSPQALKQIARAPKGKDHHLFEQLTALHSSQMSEAMRKLAEHKLELHQGKKPQLLAELEQLVQPDMAIDMYNMPLETVQCFQEIFNLQLDEFASPEDIKFRPTTRPSPQSNLKDSRIKIETDAHLPDDQVNNQESTLQEGRLPSDYQNHQLAVKVTDNPNKTQCVQPTLQLSETIQCSEEILNLQLSNIVNPEDKFPPTTLSTAEPTLKESLIKMETIANLPDGQVYNQESVTIPQAARLPPDNQFHQLAVNVSHNSNKKQCVQLQTRNAGSIRVRNFQEICDQRDTVMPRGGDIASPLQTTEAIDSSQPTINHNGTHESPFSLVPSADDMQTSSKDLLLDFQHLLHLIDSAADNPTSRLLIPTAVNCISTLVQEFIKQFSALACLSPTSMARQLHSKKKKGRGHRRRENWRFVQKNKSSTKLNHS